MPRRRTPKKCFNPRLSWHSWAGSITVSQGNPTAHVDSWLQGPYRGTAWHISTRGTLEDEGKHLK